MTKKVFINALVFLAGGVAGFFTAKKLFEEHYAELAQDEIEDMRRYYEEKMEPTEEEDTDRPNPNFQPSYEEYEKRVEPYRSNNNPLVRPESGTRVMSYNEIAKAKMAESLGIRSPSEEFLRTSNPAQDIEDEEEEEDEEVTDDAGYSEDEYNDQDRLKNPNPYPISEDSFHNENPDYDKISLYYYTYDDLLCEEDNEIITNVGGTVGFDVIEQLEKRPTAWARNDMFEIDYEICVVRNHYNDVVDQHETRNMSPREKYAKQMKNKKGYGESEE